MLDHARPDLDQTLSYGREPHVASGLAFGIAARTPCISQNAPPSDRIQSKHRLLPALFSLNNCVSLSTYKAAPFCGSLLAGNGTSDRRIL